MVRKIILLRHLEKSIVPDARKNRNNSVAELCQFQDASSVNWAKFQAVLHHSTFKFFTTYIYLYSPTLSNSIQVCTVLAMNTHLPICICCTAVHVLHFSFVYSLQSDLHINLSIYAFLSFLFSYVFATLCLIAYSIHLAIFINFPTYTYFSRSSNLIKPSTQLANTWNEKPW